MHFKSGEKEFSLSIEGYEFPEQATANYDSNWLYIFVSARNDTESWTHRNPSLFTYEVAELASWLKKLGKGKYKRRGISFTEPNLAFELLPDVGEPHILRVILSHETAPPYLLGTEEAYDGYDIDFPLCDLDLAEASESLRKQLAEYPRRTKG